MNLFNQDCFKVSQTNPRLQHIGLCQYFTCSSSGFSLPISCSSAGSSAAFCWMSWRITWNWGWFLRKLKGLPWKRQSERHRRIINRHKHLPIEGAAICRIRPLTSPSTWWRASVGGHANTACRCSRSRSATHWRRHCIRSCWRALISAWNTLKEKSLKKIVSWSELLLVQF